MGLRNLLHQVNGSNAVGELKMEASSSRSSEAKRTGRRSVLEIKRVSSEEPPDSRYNNLQNRGSAADSVQYPTKSGLLDVRDSRLAEGLSSTAAKSQIVSDVPVLRQQPRPSATSYLLPQRNVMKLPSLLAPQVESKRKVDPTNTDAATKKVWRKVDAPPIQVGKLLQQHAEKSEREASSLVTPSQLGTEPQPVVMQSALPSPPSSQQVFIGSTNPNEKLHVILRLDPLSDQLNVHTHVPVLKEVSALSSGSMFLSKESSSTQGIGVATSKPDTILAVGAQLLTSVDNSSHGAGFAFKLEATSLHGKDVVNSSDGGDTGDSIQDQASHPPTVNNTVESDPDNDDNVVLQAMDGPNIQSMGALQDHSIAPVLPPVLPLVRRDPTLNAYPIVPPQPTAFTQRFQSGSSLPKLISPADPGRSHSPSHHLSSSSNPPWDVHADVLAASSTSPDITLPLFNLPCLKLPSIAPSSKIQMAAVHTKQAKQASLPRSVPYQPSSGTLLYGSYRAPVYQNALSRGHPSSVMYSEYYKHRSSRMRQRA
ncbi:hypothetical protein CEUSTIGMA_g6702.t1 [Chlamydomonas eustigma]|uniref:Uncharacterized protein n=1 Tax=Chlamydomonas eustigma TaxID=1157962 RepID=A0A250X8P8_9CHLO|nr:hypothetical protein CEUSTIGMA_g6702.t1 [Chlamydomonas eustigma]|eukprot:GAX79262.1 hypothetical protein CEUSTIGMA_g6702.t1 [Chlamydomonas eustigma]